jgi:hypothetical protein
MGRWMILSVGGALVALLAGCGEDDNELNQPEPEPSASDCRVCDVTLVACGGYGPFEIGYVEECIGDGCACEAVPCQSAGVPVFDRSQLVCGILLGL